MRKVCSLDWLTSPQSLTYKVNVGVVAQRQGSRKAEFHPLDRKDRPRTFKNKKGKRQRINESKSVRRTYLESMC